jgi:hypothetical protein
VSRACAGCGRVVKRGSRCARCKRGGGYGGDHRRRRAEVEGLILSGVVVLCARCGRPIGRAERWELDHTDDRRGYLGASHAKCNARAGAAATNGGAR